MRFGVDCLHADKHESFLQIGTMIFGGGGQAFQIYQNTNFAMSLQYLKNEVKEEVDFLHADKHESFLQVDFKTLGIKTMVLRFPRFQ